MRRVAEFGRNLNGWQPKPWQMRLFLEGAGLIGVSTLYFLGSSAPSAENSADMPSAQGQAIVAGELIGNARTPNITIPAAQATDSLEQLARDVPQGVRDYSMPLFLEGVLVGEAAAYILQRRHGDESRRQIRQDRQAFDEIVAHSYRTRE